MKALMKTVCWFVGHYPAGKTGPGEPVENHHCGRCGTALYATISLTRTSAQEKKGKGELNEI